MLFIESNIYICVCVYDTLVMYLTCIYVYKCIHTPCVSVYIYYVPVIFLVWYVAHTFCLYTMCLGAYVQPYSAHVRVYWSDFCDFSNSKNVCNLQLFHLHPPLPNLHMQYTHVMHTVEHMRHTYSQFHGHGPFHGHVYETIYLNKNSKSGESGD